MAHKLHAKADFEKVQELVGQIQQEVVTQIQNVKKETKKKATKKNEDLEKTKQDQEFANEKMFEEIKSLSDKLRKLAN